MPRPFRNSCMKKLIAVLLFSIIALPSLAQEPADANRACYVLPSIFGESQNWKIGQAQRIDDTTCEFKNISYDLIPSLAYEIDRVVVSKIDLKSVADAKLPPSLRVEATGIRAVPQRLPARTRYLLRQGARPFRVIVDYDYDRAGKVLHINEISQKDPYTVRVKAELANVDDLNELGKQLSGRSFPIGSVFLKSLDFYLDDQGFFANTILMSVGAAFIDEESADPAAEVEELRRNAIAWVEVMLNQMETTKDSIAAVTALIAALPRPEKIFELSIKPSRPISLLEISANYSHPEAMKKLMKSLSLTASYHEGDAECIP